ncbi:MAG: tRNA (N(6)-L-threonylcarbamoyladenosine(37)-C(2))-methylthiotransferase MtaB [Anaerolineaceae bacterium]|nr:tRNA (N(6)-L-threonylcarbamoyladenosine(37)-C(2))-methylthiotransferase MtaB [Anaerolineaceae bacterium]
MKVFFDTIGCRLNQAEIERYAVQFAAQGHELVPDAESADMVIVNTCSVTAAAASDSRGKIRSAARNGARVVVTGCWSTMEPEIAAMMEGVSHVIPNAEKDHLPQTVLGTKEPDFDVEPLKRIILPGIHARTRAFIKIQDGCDNHCTFCVTHLVRGKARSVSETDVLRDVQAAINAGGKEIVLTGVNLGAWGLDLDPRKELADLIEFLLRETDIPRIRLSSLESWNLSDRFLQLWHDPRMCPQFHLPLQSGSNSVLKRMARRTTLAEFRRLTETALTVNPDFAITTDVIAGFPGETDEEFAETVSFIESIPFAGGHVFPYSPRPGTPAARMSGQIGKSVQKARAKQLRDIFENKTEQFEQSFVGSTQQILWESSVPLPDGRWETHGLSGNYLSVKTIFPSPVRNRIDSVLLTGREDGKLIGKVI